MRRGTRVGQAYVAVTADGDGINEEIVDAVDDAGKEMGAKGEAHGQDYGDGFSDEAFDRIRENLERGFARYGFDREGIKAGDSFGNSMVDRLRERLDGAHNLVESLTRRVLEAGDRDVPLLTVLTHGLRSAQNEATVLERQLRALMKSEGMLPDLVSGNDRDGKGRSLGDLVGSAFGAGSRNNFLNLLGRSVGSVVNMVERGSKVVTGFADGFKTAADNASLLSRIMSGFSGAGSASGITTLLRGISASGPVAVVALGAVLAMMSVLASVAGALVGILTALASTIASALVGALAVAAPLLGAFAVSAGLVVAAFTSMTNAQKDYLFSAFQPFKAALTGLGQIIMREFTRPLYDGQSAIQIWSANLQRALVPLAGVAQLTARAFADAGNIITASLSGPGFQRFFSSLGTELPTIVRNLSRALGDFLNGVGGLFAAIMPFVTQFSGYLRDVARDFSNFTNSARGQNSITDFVSRALESLKSLWGAVKQISGFIADVFFSRTAQRAGNNIFDSIADTFAGFRRSFARNIANGNVERWFNDAIRFGSALWSVIKALWDVFMALYNSGVLKAVGDALSGLATVMSGLSTVITPLINALGQGLPGSLGAIPGAVQAAMGPLGQLWNVIKNINNAINELQGGGSPDKDRSGAFTDFYTTTTIPGVTPTGIMGPWAPGTAGNPSMPALPDLEDLIVSGNTALNATYESMGGYLPDPVKSGVKDAIKHHAAAIEEEWVNPLKDWAAKLLDTGKSTAAEIKASAREARQEISAALEQAAADLGAVINDLGKDILNVVSESAASTDFTAVTTSINSIITQFADAAAGAMTDAQAAAAQTIAAASATRDQMIATAQAEYNAAVQAVASASTPKELRKAERALKKAERNLGLAQERGRNIVEDAERAAQQMIDNASAAQDKINNATAILAGQGLMDWTRVFALMDGMDVANATLADYAVAREQVALQLEEANKVLADAISMRDNYASQVANSIRSFGSIMTTQARVLNGVAQALTADDVTDNLQSRLEKIRKFQENLRQLMAQGLTQEAFQQIVDAGVDSGSAMADAILSGGQGSISEINSLTDQISAAADQLGLTTSTYMYQAGVDAAQGIVDGLESLSDKLTTAAYNLGLAVAQAIRDALGIASPSRVLRADMAYVGDGMSLGLDDQHLKVSAAAARLSEQIRVSPEVAARAGSQTASTSTEAEGEGVSGNGKQFVWHGDIVTPTEDPEAVVHEVVNELTARL